MTPDALQAVQFRLQKLGVWPWITTIPTILVGGSNGKGSTCAHLEYLARQSGYKTGLFTSPHLVSQCERVRLCGMCISVAKWEKYSDHIESKLGTAATALHFFERVFYIALLYFQAEKITYLIAEVGLGGRLDATNTLSPCLCVLTSFSFEHTTILGSTLNDIAKEKAFIARRHVPLVLGASLDRMKQTEPVHWADAEAGLLQTTHVIGPKILFCKTDEWMTDSYPKLNKLTAMMAWKEATGRAVSLQMLTNTLWPGRFEQRLLPKPYPPIPIVLEALHNPEGAVYFVDLYKKTFGNRACTLVFATLKNKDWLQILQIVSVLPGTWILTEGTSERKVVVQELANVAQKFFKDRRLFSTILLQHAFDIAVKEAQNPIVFCGSVAFLGDVYALLGWDPFC